MLQRWKSSKLCTSNCVVTRCQNPGHGSHSAPEHPRHEQQHRQQLPHNGTRTWKNKAQKRGPPARPQGHPPSRQQARWPSQPPSSSPSDPASIKFMQLPQLQQLVAQQCSSLTPPQLAAVILRAAKLRPAPNRQQRDALLLPAWAALRTHLAACRAYEVVLVLWAAAKLGWADTDLYTSTLQHLLAPEVLTALQPRNLSNLVYAVAAAPAAVAHQHAGPTLQAVLPVLRHNLHTANAQDLANVFWALGTFGSSMLGPWLSDQELQELLQGLLLHTQRQLDTVTPQGVSNTLWALARLGHPVPQPVLLALIQQLLSAAARASPHDAASSLWGLATLWQQQQQQSGYQPQPPPQQQQRRPHLRQHQQQKVDEEAPIMSQQHSEQQGADGLQQQPVSPELQQCVLQLLAIVGSGSSAAAAAGAAASSCHSLALAVWAAAKMGVEVPHSQLQQLLALCVQHSSAASAQDIANILWAAATMHAQRQQQQGWAVPLQQHQADTLLAAAAAAAGAAAAAAGAPEPQAIANTLWATAKLGLQVPVATLKGLVKPFTGCALAGTASTQEIANVLLALATLQAGTAGVSPQVQPLQQQPLQPSLQQQQQQQQQGMSEPIPARVVQVLISALMQQLQDSSPQEVCNTLWAAAKLQYSVDPWDIQQLVDHTMGQQVSTVPARGREGRQGTGNIPPAEQPLPLQQQQQQQQRQQRRLTQSEAANLLWSLASLQQLQKQQQQRVGEVALPVPLPQLQVLLSLVWGQGSLDTAGEQQLANSLWAAAAFEPCVLPEGLLSKATLTALAGRVEGMGLQAVSNLAYALGQLGAVEAVPVLVLLLQRGLLLIQQATGSSSLPQQPAAAAAKQSWPQSQRIRKQAGETMQAASTNSRHSSSLNHGQSSSSKYGGALGPVDDWAIPSSSSSSRVPQVVCNLCWSAAALGLRGQQQLLGDLVAAVAGRRWSEVTPIGASQLYMLHMALQLEQQQEQQQQQQQQRKLPVRLSKQRQQDALAGAATAPGLAGCLSPQQLDQCRAAWLSCGSNPQDNREPAAPDSMPAAPPSAPTATPAAAAAVGSAAPGFGLQRKVFLAARQLQGLAASPRYEAPTSDGLFSIDIAAQTASGVQLAIEVDGPSHFRLPDMALTGTTLFRNSQLVARGYVVVSVPYTGWNAAVAAQRQQQGQSQGHGQQLQGPQQQRRGERVQRSPRPVQQQQQPLGQVVSSEGQGVATAEGLLGVEYLQGLVGAAVLAAAQPRAQGQPPPVSPPPSPDSLTPHVTTHPAAPASTQSGGDKGQRQDAARVLPAQGRQRQQAAQAAPLSPSAEGRQGQPGVQAASLILSTEGLPAVPAVQEGLQGEPAAADPAARGALRASRRRKRLSS